PPVVAPITPTEYVILDGANRCYAFQQLAYPNILVQVVTYESGYVDLKTWSHIVSDWDAGDFMARLSALPDVELVAGQHAHAIAHILLRDGRLFAVQSSVENTHQRNVALRKIVALY